MCTHDKKRTTKNRGCFMALIMIVSLLCSCDLYSGNAKKIGKFSLRLNAAGDQAMVESWTWSGDLNDTVIEVPDKFEEKTTINALGGAVGANASLQMFTILPDSDVQFRNGSGYDEDPTVKDIVFTLKLGKSIHEINVDFTKSAYAQVSSKDGSTAIYRILIQVECSEENQTFYSKDGKLYRRDGNSLVSSIPYPESND